MEKVWYDLHVAGGMYRSDLSTTGYGTDGIDLVFFPWYRTAFIRSSGWKYSNVPPKDMNRKVMLKRGDTKLAAHREKKEKEMRFERVKEAGVRGKHHSDMYSVTSPFVYWQEIYDKLRRQNPDISKSVFLLVRQAVSFNRFGNQRASDRYSFNTDNGEFTETSLYQHQDKSGKDSWLDLFCACW